MGRLSTVLIVGFFAVALQLAKMGVLYKDSLKHANLSEAPPVACPALDKSAALDRFRRLLTFPTVSNSSTPDHVNNHQVLRDMLAALEESYPAVWATMTVEEVGAGGYSRLLTWTGSNPALQPALFVSHYDVVPVTPGTEGDWLHPPFSGDLADGYVWGRGSADIKFSVAALLQAAEGLIAEGWAPQRTIMFAFGHDEEVGGGLGAAATASLLSSRGVALDVVVDEGGLVLLDGMQPFVAAPVAMVGLAEKGYCVIEVVLRSSGGHAAMPPTDGSDIGSQVWRLSSALLLLQPPTQLAAPITDMLLAMAPHAPAWLRPLLASCEQRRSWLANRVLGFVFRRLLSREAAAMVTHTLALTRMKAGVADNVLPQEALLSFNVRVLPGSGPEVMVEHLQRAASWARVQAEVRLIKNVSWAGSSVTSSRGRHYGLLRRAIQETWPREEGQAPVAVVPFMLMGGTDSKHYAPLSTGGVLRFVPYGMNKTAGDLGLIHSTNERIRADHFGHAVCTYARTLRLFAEAEAEAEGGAE